MIEGLATTYWKLVTGSKNPSEPLLAFYREALGINGDRNLNLFIKKQVKLYGRHLVFFTILELAGKENLNKVDNLMGLVSYILKRKLEEVQNNNKSNSPNLDIFVREVEERKRRLQSDE